MGQADLFPTFPSKYIAMEDGFPIFSHKTALKRKIKRSLSISYVLISVAIKGNFFSQSALIPESVKLLQGLRVKYQCMRLKCGRKDVSKCK